MRDEQDPSADVGGSGEGTPEPEADDMADREAASDAGPSDAERRGLGDIGELGDEAATGQVGFSDDAPQTDIPESMGAGGTMGFDPEPTADVERSAAARQGGGPMDERATRRDPDGGINDAETTPEHGAPPR